MHWYLSKVRARRSAVSGGLVDGVSVITVVSGLHQLCVTFMLLQVSYLLVWGVGVGNLV